jgi:hypothetical protein
VIALWVVVAIGFSATVFTAGGPVTYADDALRRIVGGAFLALGIFGTPLLRLLTRSKPNAERVERDERDEWIDAKATDAGCVPVGWMWVMAYSTLILSHLGPALVSLFLDAGAFRHAEG